MKLDVQHVNMQVQRNRILVHSQVNYTHTQHCKQATDRRNAPPVDVMYISAPCSRQRLGQEHVLRVLTTSSTWQHMHTDLSSMQRTQIKMSKHTPPTAKAASTSPLNLTKQCK